MVAAVVVAASAVVVACSSSDGDDEKNRVGRIDGPAVVDDGSGADQDGAPAAVTAPPRRAG